MKINLVTYMQDGRRKDIPVTGRKTVIGRRDDCQVRVPLPGISRQHCEIVVAGDRVMIRDLASSNGTYVNNRRVNEATLKPGDRLTVGSIIFTIQINGKPADVALAPSSSATETATGSMLLGEEDDIDIEDPISALEELARQNEDDEMP